LLSSVTGTPCSRSFLVEALSMLINPCWKTHTKWKTYCQCYFSPNCPRFQQQLLIAEKKTNMQSCYWLLLHYIIWSLSTRSTYYNLSKHARTETAWHGIALGLCKKPCCGVTERPTWDCKFRVLFQDGHCIPASQQKQNPSIKALHKPSLMRWMGAPQPATCQPHSRKKSFTMVP
jgi:hypothetical protein